jgi:hypothetical protein
MTWLVSDCTVNYRPVFSSEKATSKEEKSNCQTKKEEQAKIWSKVPKGGPIPRRINWSTDCRPQEELQLQLDRLCGLVVGLPSYTTEMYCVSCEVRTEFIYVM